MPGFSRTQHGNAATRAFLNSRQAGQNSAAATHALHEGLRGSYQGMTQGLANQRASGIQPFVRDPFAAIKQLAEFAQENGYGGGGYGGGGGARMRGGGGGRNGQNFSFIDSLTNTQPILQDVVGANPFTQQQRAQARNQQVDQQAVKGRPGRVGVVPQLGNSQGFKQNV